MKNAKYLRNCCKVNEKGFLIKNHRIGIHFLLLLLILLTLDSKAEVILSDDFSGVKTVNGVAVPDKPSSGKEKWESMEVRVENGRVYPFPKMQGVNEQYISLQLPGISDEIKKITLSLGLCLGNDEIEGPDSWISFGFGKARVSAWDRRNLLSGLCWLKKIPMGTLVEAHSLGEILKLNNVLKLKNNPESPQTLSLTVDLETNQFEISNEADHAVGTLNPDEFDLGLFKRFAKRGLFLNIQFFKCRESAYVSNLSVSYE